MSATDTDHVREPPLKAVRAMQAHDAMPTHLRPLVHEYGSAIVNACVSVGITKPNQIHFLVHEIWQGARQPHQKLRPMGEKREQSRWVAYLDWLLIQSGSQLSAATLLRVLWQGDFVIIPRTPSTLMIEASTSEVSGHKEIMTRREKHSRRLRAAVNAQVKSMWPHLFAERKAP